MTTAPHTMYRTCILAALVLLMSADTNATARPLHSRYGIRPAYLTFLQPASPQDSLLVGRPDLAHHLWLTVSAKGQVTDVASSRVISGEFRVRLLRWLSRNTFEPARVNNKKKAGRLPAYLFLSEIDSTAQLILPIDSTGHINDYTLYAEAISAWGIRLPEIQYFPWYHAVLPRGDSSGVLRYVLLSVVLDKKGAVTSVELAGTNFEAFAGQILNAANWGKFSPVVARKAPKRDTVFVLVTFFPTTRYPTVPWRPARLDSLDLQDRLAIRLLVDTGGFAMVPPMPKTRRDSVMAMKYPAERAATLIPLRFGRSGRASVDIDSARAPASYAWAKTLVKQLAFYPALDFRGDAVESGGLIEILPESESSIRIRYWWLQPM